MSFPSDLEIAQAAKPLHINEIGAKLGLTPDFLQYYGNDKAKLPLHLIDETRIKRAKLILVTAINPTPIGPVTAVSKLYTVRFSNT